MKIFTLFIRGKQIIPAAVVLLILSIDLSAEDQIYNYFYRVYFIDKGENKPWNYPPSDLLSERALDRRLKYQITVPDVRDIPVSRQYINEIISRGFALHCCSKWMNTALFKTNEAIDEQLLLDLPFVSGVKLVKKPAGKSSFAGKLDLIAEADDKLLPGFHIAMLNGTSVHLSGYDGRGILIAVPDGGFLNADRISSLGDLRSRKGIRYIRFCTERPFCLRLSYTRNCSYVYSGGTDTRDPGRYCPGGRLYAFPDRRYGKRKCG